MTKRTKRPWYHKYIISALRKTWRWSPERRAVLKAATGCSVCRKKMFKKDLRIDHVEPVVSTTPQERWSWDIYIARLFCPASNLQPICEACHDVKTKAERAARKKAA
jgi:5-methylcytosine-specific restriction endonuclease McrA